MHLGNCRADCRADVTGVLRNCDTEHAHQNQANRRKVREVRYRLRNHLLQILSGSEAFHLDDVTRRGILGLHTRSLTEPRRNDDYTGKNHEQPKRIWQCVADAFKCG